MEVSGRPVQPAHEMRPPGAGPSPELALERRHLAAHGLVALCGLIQLPLQLPAVGVDALGLFLRLLQLPLELLDPRVSFLSLSRRGPRVRGGLWRGLRGWEGAGQGYLLLVLLCHFALVFHLQQGLLQLLVLLLQRLGGRLFLSAHTGGVGMFRIGRASLAVGV